MGCLCTKCGVKYVVDLNIPNGLWIQISNLRGNGGLLCGACIMRYIEQLSDYDSWKLVKENDVNKEE